VRIAINTRFLLTSKMEGFGWYTYEVCKRLVELHPEHDFFFFFDRPFDDKFIFGDNVTPVILNPPARHPILFYIWFEWSVKRALKKHKIDIFFSPDGYLSLRSEVKQIAVIHDLNFEHYPQDIPWNARKYLRYFFPKFAYKASKIITVSNYSKQDIISTYGISADNINVIWNGASTVFQPLKESSKLEVKEKYTAGNDYFLFVGALHPRKNLFRLLEAFVQFKTISYSLTKLVIVGEALWKQPIFSSIIPTALKNEIIFTGHLSLDELARVMGSAKLFAFVPYFEGFGIPLVEAMRCGTPILSGNLTCLPEVAGDAAIYCDPFNVEEICEKLTELDNNIELLKDLSVNGIERSKLFSWEFCAQEVGKVLDL